MGGRLTGESPVGLQPNDSFAAHPVAAGIESVPGDYEHVRAVAGYAAVSPNAATVLLLAQPWTFKVVYVHADAQPR